jgi:translation initiation factor 6 (eIF-6)
MFEIDAEKLKKHIAQNKAVWIHFVYSRLCADAEMYDCQTYKKLNEKYRDKISYVMVTEIAHSKLARELKNGCNLVGYHTFVVDNKKRHNEVRTLKRLKKDVFGFKNKDTLMYQTNYIIINNEIVYATDQTLDKKKIEELLDKL